MSRSRSARRPACSRSSSATSPGRDYEGVQALRHSSLRRLVPRAAGPRRLPAALPVRGLVPVAGTRRRSTSSARSRPRPRPSARSHDAGRARAARGRSLAEDGGPARGGAAAGGPRPDAAIRGSASSPRPARAPRARARRSRCAVEAAYEGHLLHSRALARSSTPATPTWRCWPATGSTRSASRALAELGASRRWASSPTSSRCARRPRPPATTELERRGLGGRRDRDRLGARARAAGGEGRGPRRAADRRGGAGRRRERAVAPRG